MPMIDVIIKHIAITYIITMTMYDIIVKILVSQKCERKNENTKNTI